MTDFHPATRTQLRVEIETDFDPTGATLAIHIDGTWWPCTWTGPAVETGLSWRRDALTDDYFAGPDASAAGAHVLTTDPTSHPVDTRLTLGQQNIADKTEPLTVTR